jgi:hypothetical protein
MRRLRRPEPLREAATQSSTYAQDPSSAMVVAVDGPFLTWLEVGGLVDEQLCGGRWVVERNFDGRDLANPGPGLRPKGRDAVVSLSKLFDGVLVRESFARCARRKIVCTCNAETD